MTPIHQTSMDELIRWPDACQAIVDALRHLVEHPRVGACEHVFAGTEGPVVLTALPEMGALCGVCVSPHLERPPCPDCGGDGHMLIAGSALSKSLTFVALDGTERRVATPVAALVEGLSCPRCVEPTP